MFRQPNDTQLQLTKAMHDYQMNCNIGMECNVAIMKLLRGLSHNGCIISPPCKINVAGTLTEHMKCNSCSAKSVVCGESPVVKCRQVPFVLIHYFTSINGKTDALKNLNMIGKTTSDRYYNLEETRTGVTKHKEDQKKFKNGHIEMKRARCWGWRSCWRLMWLSCRDVISPSLTTPMHDA